MDSLGYKLKTLRTNNNYTQEELAKQLFVTRQTISKWENGKTTPDIQTLNRICDFYNIQLSLLLSEDHPEKKDSFHNEKLIKYLALSINIVIVLILLFNLVQSAFFLHTHSTFTWFILFLMGIILLSNMVILFISTNHKMYIFNVVIPVLILIIVHVIV
ncbi:helix-turn-helix domain-containing protein [Enterococcus sp. AZ192]|uniref:helix-turn-helix domain-containing protein n=1 Tax=unclassified Enterococcus TaxID=2608891 RepID=UPI003D26BD6D